MRVEGGAFGGHAAVEDILDPRAMFGEQALGHIDAVQIH